MKKNDIERLLKMIEDISKESLNESFLDVDGHLILKSFKDVYTYLKGQLEELSHEEPTVRTDAEVKSDITPDLSTTKMEVASDFFSQSQEEPVEEIEHDAAELPVVDISSIPSMVPASDVSPATTLEDSLSATGSSQETDSITPATSSEIHETSGSDLSFEEPASSPLVKEDPLQAQIDSMYADFDNKKESADQTQTTVTPDVTMTNGKKVVQTRTHTWVDKLMKKVVEIKGIFYLKIKEHSQAYVQIYQKMVNFKINYDNYASENFDTGLSEIDKLISESDLTFQEKKDLFNKLARIVRDVEKIKSRRGLGPMLAQQAGKAL